MRSSIGILNPEGRSNAGPAPAMPPPGAISPPLPAPESAATPSAPAASEKNLYLYSLAAFQELILSVLETAGASRMERDSRRSPGGASRIGRMARARTTLI
jgi:hypothetical protein